jgi:hypothetical protein
MGLHSLLEGWLYLFFLWKERTRFFRTLFTVSIEIDPFSDWIVVFSPAIVCGFFCNTPNIPTENYRRGLSPIKLVALKILPQMAQDISSAGLFSRKRRE